LEIGKYNENLQSTGFQKMDFSTIDEAMANIEFMKMGYNYFKNGESLVVRIEEGKKAHLIDYDSIIPLIEIRDELEEKYHQKLTPNEKEKKSNASEGKTKLSANSNFAFKEDETTRYAKTSSGERLPFKLFDANEISSGPNLLREPKDSLQSTDFALIERRFAENKSLQLFGNEKISSINDVAWLFKALEDEAVEHAFLVYDFEDKGYFVQHISTGTFDAAFVDNRLLIGNVLEVKPASITLVHNHPSGTLKVSKADINCIEKLKMALEDSGIKVNKGIIINLRSGKYVVFDENNSSNRDLTSNGNSFKEIQPYSFSKQVLVENYQPFKITNSADIAKFITSQKFGVSDKTEMLVVNNHLNIVGKFIMPPSDQVDFIISKVAKFGGSRCVIYGNNITPEEINKYNQKLHHSGIEILDAILFKSENGRKIYDSFADDGLISNVSKKINTTNDTFHNYGKPTKELKLSWLDKITIPKSEGYKDFVKNFEKLSPELFYRNGERQFNTKEKKYALFYNEQEKGKNLNPLFNLSTLTKDNSLKKIDHLPNIAKVLEKLNDVNFSNGQNYTLTDGKGMKKFFIRSAEDLKSAIEILSKRENEKICLDIKIENKNNLKSTIMEKKEFDQVDYLQNQLKYLGFGEGEKLHKDLEVGIKSAEQQFEIKTSTDKASLGNEVDFTLKFNKTESGGVFVN
jgi:hypothetical protein